MHSSLSYLPGSPFARMARILVREWTLPIREVQQAFPLQETFFASNPLGQVPVLDTGKELIFPTFLILENLWKLAGSPEPEYKPTVDRQILLTTLLAGDALVAARYQGWCGLGPTGKNHIGYDPAARNLERVHHVLAWLDALALNGTVRPNLTIPGVAIAAIVLWADARGGFDWRRYTAIANVVASLETRPSFINTQPPSWPPSES